MVPRRVEVMSRAVYRRLGGPAVRRFAARRTVRLRGGRVRNPLGVDLHVDPTDPRAALLAAGRGVLDSAAVRTWGGLVAAFAPTVVIDVGANYGEVALSCPYNESTRAIHLVEPNPRVAERLAETIRAAQPRFPPLTLHQVAASNRSGDVELFISAESSGLSSLERPVGPTCTVEARPVRDLVALRPEDRLLFKIDVEGHELAVLEGMFPLPAQSWGLCEVIHGSRELADFLHTHFRVSLIRDDDSEVESDLASFASISDAGMPGFRKDVVLRARRS